MHRAAYSVITILATLLGSASVQAPLKPESSEQSKSNDFAITIKKIRDTWIQEFNARNPKGVAALYAADAVLMRWDGSVHGYDSILAEFERSASGNAHNYMVHPLHFQRSGDLGYETGAYNVSLRDRVSEGNYLMVVKRIKGEWKIVAHATVPNPRAP